jgi:hypothetical protein
MPLMHECPIATFVHSWLHLSLAQGEGQLSNGFGYTELHREDTKVHREKQ